MKTATVLFLAVASVLAFGASLQEKKDKNQQKVSQKEIDNAIDKGVKWLLEKTKAYLKNEGRANAGDFSQTYITMGEELVLYTLVHAGITEKDETFKKLLERVLSKKPESKGTYNLALEALSLVCYDKARFQDRLAECAQALVDRQCKNGQWTYAGMPVKSDNIETEKTKIPPPKKGSQALKKITLKRRGWGPAMGDNSNTQYAGLGLRACAEADIEIDKEVLKLAKECYEKCQNDDGGWDYMYKDNSGNRDSGVHDPRKGGAANVWSQSYGSMTVGGLGTLSSYKYLLKENIKNDSHIKRAIEWMAKHFTVEKNPCYPQNNAFPDMHRYYYLYGLERAGALANIEKFGSHNWYWEGAEYLVKNQQADGHWSTQKQQAQNEMMAPVDTCFAILFLKRATAEMIHYTERSKDFVEQ